MLLDWECKGLTFKEEKFIMINHLINSTLKAIDMNSQNTANMVVKTLLDICPEGMNKGYMDSHNKTKVDHITCIIMLVIRMSKK